MMLTDEHERKGRGDSGINQGLAGGPADNNNNMALPGSLRGSAEDSSSSKHDHHSGAHSPRPSPPTMRPPPGVGSGRSPSSHIMHGMKSGAWGVQHADLC